MVLWFWGNKKVWFMTCFISFMFSTLNCTLLLITCANCNSFLIVKNLSEMMSAFISVQIKEISCLKVIHPSLIFLSANWYYGNMKCLVVCYLFDTIIFSWFITYDTNLNYLLIFEIGNYVNYAKNNFQNRLFTAAHVRNEQFP